MNLFTKGIHIVFFVISAERLSSVWLIEKHDHASASLSSSYLLNYHRRINNDRVLKCVMRASINSKLCLKKCCERSCWSSEEVNTFWLAHITRVTLPKRCFVLCVNPRLFQTSRPLTGRFWRDWRDWRDWLTGWPTNMMDLGFMIVFRFVGFRCCCGWEMIIMARAPCFTELWPYTLMIYNFVSRFWPRNYSVVFFLYLLVNYTRI